MMTYSSVLYRMIIHKALVLLQIDTCVLMILSFKVFSSKLLSVDHGISHWWVDIVCVVNWGPILFSWVPKFSWSRLESPWSEGLRRFAQSNCDP